MQSERSTENSRAQNTTSIKTASVEHLNRLRIAYVPNIILIAVRPSGWGKCNLWKTAELLWTQPDNTTRTQTRYKPTLSKLILCYLKHTSSKFDHRLNAEAATKGWGKCNLLIRTTEHARSTTLSECGS